jgi:hypothetical protein
MLIGMWAFPEGEVKSGDKKGARLRGISAGPRV